MSDIKIACPQCQQHIACGPEYSGREINCPACGTRMAVPNVTPPAAPLIPLRPSAPQAGNCPGCAAPLNPGAVICTSCGYNLQTGQRLQPQAASAPQPVRGPTRPGATRPVALKAEAKWYATPYPYLGFYVVVMFSLFVLGKRNEGLNLGFLGMAALYCFGIYITVAVAAFKDGVMKGVLCLICGIYSVYWVYKESESTFLQVAYAVNILLVLAFKFSNIE